MLRRSFLGGASASLLSGCLEDPGGAAQASKSGGFQRIVEEFSDRGKLDLSLADVRAQRGIHTGGALPWQVSGEAGNGQISRIATDEFSITWPEWNLQWGQDWTDTAAGDRKTTNDLNYIKSRGRKARGHTLYYYQVIPDPVLQRANSSSVTAGQLGDFIYENTYRRVRQWGDRVSFWVINEAIDFDRGHGMRMDPVTKKLGIDLYRILISAVKDAIPGKQVEMNDFAIERPGNTSRTNRRPDEFLEDLAEYLDKHNLMYDQIGYQCHIDWPDGSKMDYSTDRVLQSVRRLNGLGTTFAITEIDVDDRRFRGNESQRREFVAKNYYDALTRLSSIPRLTEVSTWSPFDTYNWIRSGSKDKGKYRNSGVSRTGWFDENFNRTLSYYAVCRAILDAQ